MKGHSVRGLSLTGEVVRDLKSSGFSNAETLHRLLFSFHHGSKKYQNKEVWIIDEASMLDNKVLQEILGLAWKQNNQIILVGDAQQLPSVARGGMFKVFCDRYQGAILSDIMRQEKKWGRDTSIKLSQGKIAEAINLLVEKKAIHWSNTKEDAMISLIKRWDSDKQAFPGQTSFIMEQRNSYAKILNELVRQVRIERKEIDAQGFKCETFLGSVNVSGGDRIQFRVNDKDLKVTNGLLGTLVKAEKDKFVVKTDEGREVEYNPQKFCKYQLGYAGTFHRAQGKTVDRTYVLHSPWINRNLFYVGLTRHKKNVHYFVSKDEVSCLASLKYQAGRSGDKESSVQYKSNEERQQKESESFINRLWKDTKIGLQDYFFKDKDFYKSSEFVLNNEFKVIPISTTEEKDLAKQKHPAEKPIISFAKEDMNEKLIKEYFSLMDETQNSKESSQIEAKSKNIDIKNTIHFQAWQNAVRERNKIAYEITKNKDNSKIKNELGIKASSYLEKHANKHQEMMNKKDISSLRYFDNESFNEKLKEHVDEVCSRLFPKGPAQYNSREARFRPNNSLCISLSGSKKGFFYDFVEGKGGNLISLVKQELNCDFKEAKEWILNAIDIPSDLQRFQKISQRMPSDKKWISVKPDNNKVSDDITKNKFLNFYKETNRYAYRDFSGALLYYTVRFQSLENTKKKMILPLSYGYYSEDGKSTKSWRFKQYSEENRTLYNLQALKSKPSATVLIVEGEKTADAAQEVFPEYACLTWPGGSHAVSKTDWSLLQGRKAIVWPDNDDPGYKAADKLVVELKKKGLTEIRKVNTRVLEKKFPQKWDLADPLPEGVSKKDLDNLLILSQKEKPLYPSLIIHKQSVVEAFIDEHKRLNHLEYVEKRMGLNNKEFNEQDVYKSYIASVNLKSKSEKDLIDKGLSGGMLKLLTEQVYIYHLKNDKTPSSNELEIMKNTIVDLKKYFESPNVNKEIGNYSMEKIIEKGIDICLNTNRQLQKYDIKALKEDSKEFSEKISQQCSIHEMNSQKEKVLQKEMIRG